MQDKHSNNSPYVVNSTYAKFKGHSLKKLKIKTNGKNHVLPKNINSHVNTNTNTSLLQQTNTNLLPPIVTSNSLSNINYRSKTPSNIKTTSLNEDVIPSNVSVFNKKEVQLIVSLKNELKSKNEENQKLLHTIKTIRNNQYTSNKALEQKNSILNNEIKRIYGLLEQMNYQSSNNNNVNTCNNNDIGSPLCSNVVGNSNDSVINELREQIDLLQKNLDKQILQNKKLKEANVSLNSNRANMQKANYDLQNQIQKLQDIIDNKDRIINEQVNIIGKHGINNNNNNKSNSINESDLFESNSSISYHKQYNNKNHIRKVYHINTFAFSIEGITHHIKEDTVNSILPKPIPHVHNNSNTHTKNKNISFSFIHNNFPYNKPFTNITHIPLLHVYQYTPNKVPKPSCQIISNHISFNIICSSNNTTSSQTNINEQIYYQNIISQTESNTIIYLLLKTIQSKNLLPAMLCDEILQLTPFNIEHISTFLINTLHMNNDSLYILNRLIYGMCFKENTFSYETFKQQLKLTLNDNYLTNISLDKEIHISNEIEQNALNEIITLCVKCDYNQFGFISFDMFNCICKAYVSSGCVTQKGFEYLIYLMKKGNHNENIMMLYYKRLNELLVNKKDVMWKERFIEEVERKCSMKQNTFKNVNEILLKEESKMYMEHAKVFVDDVFEKVLEEREKCYEDDIMSVNKEGVVIENMFKDEEGE